MPRYRIVRTLEDGQEISVATFGILDDAETLLASLKEYWPGDYSIQQSDSLNRFAPIVPQATQQTLSPHRISLRQATRR
jgi:hypothetical protein